MWRSTASPVRFFFVDARALVPLLLFILHWRLWTLYVAIVGIILFIILERFGMTFPVACRTLRRLAIGNIRPAIPATKRRRFA